MQGPRHMELVSKLRITFTRCFHSELERRGSKVMTIQRRPDRDRSTASLLKALILRQVRAMRALSMESVSIQHAQKVHEILLRKLVEKIPHQMGTQKFPALKKAWN